MNNTEYEFQYGTTGKNDWQRIIVISSNQLFYDMLTEISEKALVEIAELAASHVSNKASMWTHFQMKKTNILSKMSGK